MKKPDSFNQKKEKLLEILAPPSKLVYVQHPREFWYEKKDSRSHKRLLWLTRGIYLMEDWWKEHDFLISYHITDYTQYRIKGLMELKECLIELHKAIAPQQKIEQCELVLGLGTTQVLHAALYAACIHHATPSSHKSRLCLVPLYFTQQMPSYLDLKDLIEDMPQLNAKWVDIAHAKEISPADLIEIVTTPNNPDGRIQRQVTHTQFNIFDRANHWPFYLTETREEFLTEDLSKDWISTFSLGKLLSLSGSRVGYALVKDPKIAHYMRHYVLKDTHGVSSDGEVHCLMALKYLLAKNKIHDYLTFHFNKLAERWEKLEKAIRNTEMILLNTQGGNAWVKTPTDAKEYLLKHYRLIATYGPEYGADNTHARLNMICTNNEFNEFIYRLTHGSQHFRKKVTARP